MSLPNGSAVSDSSTSPPMETPGPVGVDLSAGFGARLVAFILDSVILVMIEFGVQALLVAVGMLQVNEKGDLAIGQTLALIPVNLLIVFFYYALFYRSRGATPGKLLLKLKVVDVETGQFLTFWQTFKRETVGKFCSGLILMIGYLMAAFREDKRALHDLMGHSKVIKE